jgi:hypothetical protein
MHTTSLAESITRPSLHFARRCKLLVMLDVSFSLQDGVLSIIGINVRKQIRLNQSTYYKKLKLS